MEQQIETKTLVLKSAFLFNFSKMYLVVLVSGESTENWRLGDIECSWRRKIRAKERRISLNAQFTLVCA